MITPSPRRRPLPHRPISLTGLLHACLPPNLAIHEPSSYLTAVLILKRQLFFGLPFCHGRSSMEIAAAMKNAFLLNARRDFAPRLVRCIRTWTVDGHPVSGTWFLQAKDVLAICNFTLLNDQYTVGLSALVFRNFSLVLLQSTKHTKDPELQSL